MTIFVNKTNDFKSVIETADKMSDNKGDYFSSFLIRKEDSVGLINYMIDSGINRLDVNGSDLFILGKRRYEVKVVDEII